MNKVAVAKELVRVAKLLAAGKGDLAEIKAILPEMNEKLNELKRMAEEMLRQRNEFYNQSTAKVDDLTKALLKEIQKALEDYFYASGTGVKESDNTGGLVEVFVGSRDGIVRKESKVSVHIAQLTKGSETAKYLIRNDMLDAKEGNLKDTNTVQSLMREVIRLDRQGFFDKR